MPIFMQFNVTMRSEDFRNVTARIINEYCSNCGEVSRRVKQSDVIIINTYEVPLGLQITFYVQTQSGSVLSAIALLEAVNVSLNDNRISYNMYTARNYKW